MHHLEELQRNRLRYLYNYMPDNIQKYSTPAFYYPARENHINFNDYNLDKYKHLIEIPEKYQKPKIIVDERKIIKEKLRLSNSQGKFQKMNKILKQQNKQQFDKKVQNNDLPKLKPFLSIQQRGNKIDFIPGTIYNTALYDSGCITCGKQNIEIKYYKERHICINCRQYVKTYKNDPAIVFLSLQGELLSYGIKISNNPNQKHEYYKINPYEMRIDGYNCFATVNQDNQLVMLLSDDQSRKKVNAEDDLTQTSQKSVSLQQIPQYHEQKIEKKQDLNQI